MAEADGLGTVFVKMHGLGNDFVLFDFVKANAFTDADAARWARGAVRLCNRRTGVGADGVVLVLPSDHADVRMVIFNSDGSEARMCGNASRCVAVYAQDSGLARGPSVSIEAKGATVRAEVILEGEFAGQVRVDMGAPVFRPDRIPVAAAGPFVVGEAHDLAAGRFEITCVSMGNPHCVVFVPDVAAVDLERLGPAIERDPLFPDRTNVEFVQVNGKEDLTVRVWERGAGPTLACGTGACASLVAASRRGFSGRSARVHLPGGTLFVEWNEDDHVFMTGPATHVFTGIIDDLEEWLK
ncbi:MAG: diaminopimelate epimerase [Firmicutes bacterium]|nr:diaminopimelate epimerase [Bacillota bacterium]MDH7495104.1 diaminopimelate epimerase [Bacillota bacterium]